MKKHFLLLSLSVLYPQSTDLDLLYYTYDEIRDSLYAWQAEFGSTGHKSSYYENSIVYQLDSIGVSSNEKLPIYAVKLSINADQEEEHDARVLILGQCHAEEIYGVEMSMALIDWLLHPDEQTTMSLNNNLLPFMYNLEIWVVPTHNPEGLNVVHGYEDGNGIWQQDVSFRKNKTDVNENTIFDYTPFYPDHIAGNDSDGVDLNRNYGLNWFLGDDKYELNLQSCPSNQTYSSNYDYFRGSEPFSEKEIQSIRDFVIEKQFLLSIAYHSSRSGCVSERVIYPWAWEWDDDNGNDIVDEGEAKISPDYEIIQHLAKNIAYHIQKESGGYYNPRPQKSRNGNAHDWIYAETGCIQFLIEMGSSNIQPINQEIIDETIQRNREGLFYFLHEAAGSGDDTRHIRGVVTDALSGTRLGGVEVRALEFHGSVLKPRLTDSSGRYHRLLPLGDHTLEFIAEGYQSQVINIGNTTVINIELIPLDQYEITFILENSQDVSGSVTIELTDASGFINTFNLTEEPLTNTLNNQDYSLLAFGNSIVPYTSKILVTSNDTVFINLENKPLESVDLIDVNTWQTADHWKIHNGKLISQTEELYSSESNITIRLDNLIEIDRDQLVSIEMNLAYELEWDRDTAYFNIFSEDTLIQVAYWTDQNWEVHSEFYFVELEQGVSYGLEFSLISDETISYRGVEIHDIYYYGSPTHLSHNQNIVSKSYTLHQNYPNPFNPITKIELTVPIAGDIEVEIYNLLGQSIYILASGYKDVGTYTLIWDASHVSSGMYLVKAQADGFISTQKLMLLK